MYVVTEVFVDVVHNVEDLDGNLRDNIYSFSINMFMFMLTEQFLVFHVVSNVDGTLRDNVYIIINIILKFGFTF